MKLISRKNRRDLLGSLSAAETAELGEDTVRVEADEGGFSLALSRTADKTGRVYCNVRAEVTDGEKGAEISARVTRTVPAWQVILFAGVAAVLIEGLFVLLGVLLFPGKPAFVVSAVVGVILLAFFGMIVYAATAETARRERIVLSQLETLCDAVRLEEKQG